MAWPRASGWACTGSAGVIRSAAAGSTRCPRATLGGRSSCRQERASPRCLIGIYGKARSDRGGAVVPGALRLPGDVRPETGAQAQGRAERSRRKALPRQARASRRRRRRRRGPGGPGRRAGLGPAHAARGGPGGRGCRLGSNGARHRHRDRRRPRRLHQPGRGPQELAPQALQGQGRPRRRPRAPDAGRRGEAVLDRDRRRVGRRQRQRRALPRRRRRRHAGPEDGRLRGRLRIPRSRRPQRPEDLCRRCGEVHDQRRHRRLDGRRARQRQHRDGPEPGRRRDRGNQPLHHGRPRDPRIATARWSATTPARSLTTPVYEGPMRYAGVDDHYFMSAALLGTTPTPASRTSPRSSSAPMANRGTPSSATP